MSTVENPLLGSWKGYEFGLPPFTSFQASHFEPAFEIAMKQHTEDLKEIVSSSEPATFDNTIATFDKAGHMYKRIQDVFENLCSSMATPDLQAVQLKLAGPLAAHDQSVYVFPGLFERISAVQCSLKADSSGFTEEQIRLVDRFHTDFVRSGAKFDQNAKKRYAEITEKLAELTTKFTQNVVTDESDVFLELEEADKVGLPDDVVAAAKEAALARNKGDKCVITLSRSLVVPFLTFSANRELRKKAWMLWTKRGELDPSRDNLAIAKEILKLRHEQASMHGFKTYAEFATSDTMAGNPQRVQDLLEKVWAPAKLSIASEREEIEKYLKEHGTGCADSEPFVLEPWDWRYYAEKVRQTKYNIDDNEVKPYFPLNRMVDAIFDCAQQLFGLTFKHRPDLTSYHPDVKTYEVYETAASGEQKMIAVFLHDNYARPYKQGGAWMNSYRIQSRNNCDDNAHILPIVANNNNFNKGKDESSTLLSFDDAITLFHEFGHGLHGMLSNVTYQRLSGTNVLRDFVELPSQLFEHWISERSVLKKHARHYLTGEPIPQDLLQRLMNARSFNQGFNTVEYTASALVDTALHSVSENLDTLNISKFEETELAKLGMPQGIVMRHRPAHFQHLFSGSSYAAAYYVYLWAEVLDADAFDAFLETGDIFDTATAQRLRRYIYSTGNSLNPMEAYRLFRGRDAVIEPMLKKKGLLKS